MYRSIALIVALLILNGASFAQRAQNVVPEKERVLNAELFIAIGAHDSASLNKTLANGADVHMRNWLNFTPLMWSAIQGDQKIVDILLKHGARLEDPSIYGTALSMAENALHEKLALHLLDKGAKPNSVRVDGISLIMMAANNGHTEMINTLLKANCDVNAADIDGDTALIYAARMGQTEAARHLINSGAKIDVKDSHGRTPLMYASENGQVKMVEFLIGKHAGVNLKDKQNASPLLLAARYCGDPEIVQLLIRAGADSSARDSHGKTALSLTTSRGYTEASHILMASGGNSSLKSVSTANSRNIKQAVQVSVFVLQTGLKVFNDRAPCTSCHHQGLGLMALGQAAQHGYIVNNAIIGSTLKRVGEDGKSGADLIHRGLSDHNIAKTVPAVDIGDFSIGSGYIFGGMIANGIPSNPGLSEAAQFIANQQNQDGSWGYGMDRVPIQSSYITNTALVLQVLKTYGDQQQLAPAVLKANSWLQNVPVRNSEEKASKLLGLYWSGSKKEEMMKFIQDLTSAQRADGGWSELDTLKSDAYATGMSLYALRVGGGMAADDPIFQRGVNFLLRTQDEDGSWYVNKRAIPANVYFDAGFPHGESQYISFGATCWAAMALLQADEPAKTAYRY